MLSCGDTFQSLSSLCDAISAFQEAEFVQLRSTFIGAQDQLNQSCNRIERKSRILTKTYTMLKSTISVFMVERSSKRNQLAKDRIRSKCIIVPGEVPDD